ARPGPAIPRWRPARPGRRRAPPARREGRRRRARWRSAPSFHGLGLQAHLAVFGLEPEVPRLSPLLGQDARRLLRDDLLEALELERGRLARGLARLQEPVEERSYGVGVPSRVLHADLARTPTCGASGRRRRCVDGRRGRLPLVDPVDAQGAPFFDGPHPLVPELVEGGVARAQGLVAEPLTVVADLRRPVFLVEALHAGPEVRRRLLLDATEELLPLDLELTEGSLEDVEVVVDRRGRRHGSGPLAHEQPEQRQP